MNRPWKRHIRQFYRWWSGDLAYERYLLHWHTAHAGQQAQPLNRRDFFRERTLRRWQGVNRCC